jgi:integrase
MAAQHVISILAPRDVGRCAPPDSAATGVQQVISVLTPGDGGRCAPLDSAATFEEVARRYIAVKEPRWGAHADATGKSVIQKHLIGNLGHRRVEELTAEDIQMFIDGMVRNNSSHSLLKKAVAHLRAILELAHDLDIIKRNPMRNPAVKFEYKSRKPKSERYLSLEECRALLSTLSGRDHLIVRMFIQLGLRPEELFALRRNDVEGEFIRIDEVFTKGQIRETKPEESVGNVYVPPGLLLELRAWMVSTDGNDKDWLFSALRPSGFSRLFPIGINSFRNRVLKPAAEKAGLSNVDLLTLRRTCAAHFGRKANANDAQMQMRLSSPLTAPKPSQQPHSDSLKRAAVALEAEIFTQSATAWLVAPPGGTA